MKTAIIAIKNKSEENFLKAFFNKTRIKARILQKQELEDAVFASLIEQGMETENVSEESVIRVLGRK